MTWETVIGLEVHVQLNTQSKLFSSAATAYGAAPNAQANAVDLAMPGMLPVLNQMAVEKAIKLGLSIGASITQRSVFARKNYFYPDLPKGYQISQFELPIVSEGQLTIATEKGPKSIRIERAHLEEDAGKSLHEDFGGRSGIDLNRAGTPLIEIVSAPVLSCAKEAVAYLKALHQLVRYLGISDANMQEGSFRCDANVSVKPTGSDTLGTRTETKNVNSFRFVERAIDYEVQRQIKRIEAGHSIVQETRLYDAQKNLTRPMRSKEEANDYRYFPDPDLLPVHIDPALIESIRNDMPELPWDKEKRLQSQYDLSQYDAQLLASDQALSEFYEATCKASAASAKLVANWLAGDFMAALNKNQLEISQSPIQSDQLAQLLDRVHDESLSGKMAKTVFEHLWCGEGNVDEIIAAQGLSQISDSSAIDGIIDRILADNPKQLAQYRDGKDKLLGFFVGQVMKATKGQAKPSLVNERLLPKLKGDD
jgi:aspartyl-tRNA(Asn)/glutamyl-tRNA(Gln) amidotransferase subunit B